MKTLTTYEYLMLKKQLQDTEKRQKELDRKNLVYAVLCRLEDTMEENKRDDIQELLKTVKSKDLEKFLKGK